MTSEPPHGSSPPPAAGEPKKGWLGFLNSALGLLLVGAAVGAIGLFTWQRMDWHYKQDYLRAQVLLDRRVDLIERINTDVGRYLAHADDAVAVVAKDAPPSQINEVIRLYNTEQARWFGVRGAHEALLAFHFPGAVRRMFANDVVKATEMLDVSIYAYSTDRGAANQVHALDVAQQVRQRLAAWNDLALKRLRD
jgi:hypothetical protein